MRFSRASPAKTWSPHRRTKACSPATAGSAAARVAPFPASQRSASTTVTRPGADCLAASAVASA